MPPEQISLQQPRRTEAPPEQAALGRGGASSSTGGAGSSTCGAGSSTCGAGSGVNAGSGSGVSAGSDSGVGAGSDSGVGGSSPRNDSSEPSAAQPAVHADFATHTLGLARRLVAEKVCGGPAGSEEQGEAARLAAGLQSALHARMRQRHTLGGQRPPLRSAYDAAEESLAAVFRDVVRKGLAALESEQHAP